MYYSHESLNSKWSCKKVTDFRDDREILHDVLYCCYTALLTFMIAYRYKRTITNHKYVHYAL